MALRRSFSISGRMASGSANGWNSVYAMPMRWSLMLRFDLLEEAVAGPGGGGDELNLIDRQLVYRF